MTRRTEHIIEDKVEKKKCCTCKTYKPLDKFNPAKTWDKLRSECKDCLHTNRMNNRANMTAYNKKYWVKTKDKQSAKHKEWSKKNVEHKKQYNKNYRGVHGKEMDKALWQKRKNDPIYKEKYNEYRRNRGKTDPHFRIRESLMSRLRSALHGKTKAGRSEELLGCSLEAFKIHLESKFNKDMTWENYGHNTWPYRSYSAMCIF